MDSVPLITWDKTTEHTTPGGMDSLDTTYPGYFMGGNGGFDGLVNFTQSTTENPEFTHQAISMPLKVHPLKNGSQMFYTEGDFVFVYNSAADQKKERYTVFSIWNFNEGCEKAYIEKVKENIANLGNNNIFSRKRDTTFPLTVEDFYRDWNPLGVIQTDETKAESQNRMFAVGHKGRVKMPNLWGDVKIGDVLAFVIKKVPNNYDAVYDYRGRAINAAPTEGSFLKIIPYWDKNKSQPTNISVVLKPTGNRRVLPR
jgi:hypothetical protein